MAYLVSYRTFRQPGIRKSNHSPSFYNCSVCYHVEKIRNLNNKGVENAVSLLSDSSVFKFLYFRVVLSFPSLISLLK